MMMFGNMFLLMMFGNMFLPFIPISEIPTFRSVCHCFAARSFNDRFFKAVEFRNIAFISYLKSSLKSQVEITHTKDMNQEDISNALKEEFPYCIQNQVMKNMLIKESLSRFCLIFN